MNCRKLVLAAVLTNPLVYIVAFLAVAVALVGLGVLLLYSIYRFTRHEWSIPAKPRLATPDVSSAEQEAFLDAALPAVEPPVVVTETPRTDPSAVEQTQTITATEPPARMKCAASTSKPAAVRSRPKAQASKKVKVKKPMKSGAKKR